MTGARPVTADELELLVQGSHGSPHSILGPHPHDGGVTVRVFKPLAKSVTVVYDGAKGKKSVELGHEYAGIWVGDLPVADVPGYRVEVDYGHGAITVDDPYRYLPTLGEMDLHLINEGRHELLWTVLGAHLHRYDGAGSDPIQGTSFAVWAPSAQGRPDQGRLQLLGRPRAPDAPARSFGRVGAVRARRRGPAPSTSSSSSAPTASGARRPTRWPSTPRCRPRRRRWSTSRRTPGATTRG